MSEMRTEQLAFLSGVMWVIEHLYEAARRVRDDKRGTVEVEGKLPIEVITKSGDPRYADALNELADTLAQESLVEARKLYPNFEPLPTPAKGGETSGF